MRTLGNTLGQYYARFSDTIDLVTSRYLDIQDVKSVCLLLGPYRNLTTLTAATLFLHPACQVLNHAGMRIYGNEQVDFLQNYNRGTFDRFVQFAIKISGKGQRGDQGGSITYSHAFDPQHETRKVYADTGLKLRKKNVKCLLWKESLRTSNIIHERSVDLAHIFAEEDRLLFLLPIRNPLDCAVSNLKTGHFQHFPGLAKGASVYDVVQAILDEIFWFAELKEQFPNRFFYFFQHEISHEILCDLLKFLRLYQDEAWVANALSVMKIKSGYSHENDLVDFYKDYIHGNGTGYPDISAGLLKFL